MLSILILIAIIVISLFTFFVHREIDNVKREDDVADKTCAKTEEIEDKIEQPKKEKEQIYLLNTDYIKYKVFDVYNLNSNSIIIHNDFVLKNLWIQEPYYSTFFRLLSFLDRDLLLVKDPSSEVFVLNIRDEDNREIKTKAYKVISIIDVTSRVLKINKDKILKFKQADAQNIVLSVFLYCISKSKQFQAVDIKDICSNFLEDYPFQEDVAYIISIFEEEGSQLNFIEKSFEKALKYCYKYPYTEAEDKKQEYGIKLIPKLPRKILRHI